MIWTVRTELGPLSLLEQIEPDDEPGLLALFRECDDWFEATTGSPSGPGDVQSLFYALPEGAHADDKRQFTLRDGDRIIGLVDVVLRWPRPGSCAVGTFLLAPAYRGRGVGTATAQVLLDEARHAGLDEVTATLPDGWEPGDKFARSLGFEVGEIRPGSANRRTAPAESPVRRARLELRPPTSP